MAGAVFDKYTAVAAVEDESAASDLRIDAAKPPRTSTAARSARIGILHDMARAVRAEMVLQSRYRTLSRRRGHAQAIVFVGLVEVGSLQCVAGSDGAASGKDLPQAIERAVKEAASKCLCQRIIHGVIVSAEAAMAQAVVNVGANDGVGLRNEFVVYRMEPGGVTIVARMTAMKVHDASTEVFVVAYKPLRPGDACVRVYSNPLIVQY